MLSSSMFSVGGDARSESGWLGVWMTVSVERGVASTED